jgi:hypothetical protein
MMSFYPKNNKLVARYAAAFGMLCLFVFALFLFDVDPALAQQTSFEQFGEASRLTDESIIVIIARIIRFFLGLIGIVVVILFLYAGYLYMTARGEAAPIEKAKKIFQQTIIGMIIIFSSFSIVSFILSRLTAAANGTSITTSTGAVYEPFISSLGAGVLESYYPMRNAKDIARNTKIFVTFKEDIDPATIIADYKDASTFDLNTKSVLIYKTASGKDKALTAKQVVVSFDQKKKTFVFDPVEYLGETAKDTNYTVELTSNIQKANGTAAFTGIYSKGEKWTFEVSTEIDLTPPHVVVSSVIPASGSKEDRNISVELTFNEAMNPVASTGSYITKDDSFFNNIDVLTKDGKNIEGTFSISNNYKTIGFTTTDACSKDPCGDIIYCLPANEEVSVIAKSAKLDVNDVPQGKMVGASYDGLVDASGNALDGDGDGKSCGSEKDTVKCADGSASDHFTNKFSTTGVVNDTIPKIEILKPAIKEGKISQTDDLKIKFNTLMLGSSIDSDSVSLWADPYYSMWFTVGKTDDAKAKKTEVSISHPTFIADEEGGWDYYPVVTKGVKSSYQICMFPASSTGACAGISKDAPYCCNGKAQSSQCETTKSKTKLPIVNN